MSKFSPETVADGDAIKEAIDSSEGKSKIIDLLCSRTNDQRQLIKNYYITSYGTDLSKALEKKFSGDCKTCVVALLDTPVEYDAKQLFKAIDGLGTDDSSLIEIISTRPKWKLKEIKQKYEELYKVTLEKDIKGDTSGVYRDLLIALIQGGRSESPYPNEEKCLKMCEELYQGGENSKDTDNDLFVKYFSLSSQAEIATTYRLYEKKYQKSLQDVIEKQFSGDFKKLLTTILKATINPSEYFATRVNKAVKGIGTNENLLTRVIVSRSEIDLHHIKTYYKKLYDKDMIEDVKNDTSGDYQEVLLKLLNR